MKPFEGIKHRQHHAGKEHPHQAKEDIRLPKQTKEKMTVPVKAWQKVTPENKYLIIPKHMSELRQRPHQNRLRLRQRMRHSFMQSRIMIKYLAMLFVQTPP